MNKNVNTAIQELSLEEIEQVVGGNRWYEGAVTVVAISSYSPVTAAFGMPIAAAMFTIGYF